MGFAANAVFDVIAPPPRPAPDRQAPPASEAPTFDEHLSPADLEESSTPEAAQQARAVKSKQEGGEEPELQEAALALPGPSAEQPSAPLSLQIVFSVDSPPPPPTGGDLEAPSADAMKTAAPQAADMLSPPAARDAAEAATATPNALSPARPRADEVPSADFTAPPPATPPSQAQASTAPPRAAEQIAALQTKASTDSTAVQIAPLAQARPRDVESASLEPEAVSEATGDQPKAADKPTPAPDAKSAQAQPAARDPVAFAQLEKPDAPPPQQLVGADALGSASAAAQGLAIAAEHLSARTLPAAAQVGREIIRRFDGQTTRFEMRLDPPELGRVEIRLDVSRDHRVSATVTADNPQALTELARHARELEQTLQSAGLQLADDGLSFDLRQGGEQSREASNDRGGAQVGVEADQTTEPPALAQPLNIERWRGMRVDVMA